MQRFVLIILLLTVVLTTGAIPQSVYGETDTYLTSDEKQFVRDIYLRHSQAIFVLYNYKRFSSEMAYGEYKSGKLSSSGQKDDVEIWRDFKKNRLNYLESCSLNSAPSTFKDIQTDWNTNICPKFAKIRLIVEREFVPGITLEGWLALGKRIKEECDYLGQLVDNVWNKYVSLKTALQLQREKAGVNPKKIEEEVKKELNKPVPKEEKQPKGDSLDDFCFIATAAYGTPTAVEINTLRHFRDDYLRKSPLGREFIEFYYNNSPPIAKFISEHEILRAIVREGFVDPVVKIVKFTENQWTK